ncbi:MAG: type II secretion system ATPase GspE [Myxococcota bacterium]|nr:type II secretion system ATPase GspE [Myxococcota bacterium]MDW8360815.1 type II secretion system ATPase GspE [Myxococcales bacterium]
MSTPWVGEVLVRRGVVAPERLADCVAVARERGADLLDVLLATHALDERTLLGALAAEVGVPVLAQIAVEQVPAGLADAVPIAFARQHRLVPIGERDGVLCVAIANPLATAPLDDLRAMLGRPIAAVAAPGDVIDQAINRLYERKDEAALSEARAGEDQADELRDLIDVTDEAPVIRWVNNLFYTAVKERASDIHIEPTEREVVVRYRIDGRLYPRKTAHRGFLPSIVSRVKIEAGLNIAEKRLPQDGRITKKIAGKVVDVRVSTIPTARGERIVMRLLDKEQVLLDLPELGFDPEQLRQIEHLITRPDGILLVTGPTGSGKTTTLYACLNKINHPDINILTVEDPVEYELRGISQMQVQPKIGLTFAAGLRAFLRQDPDVIMVGEIRDRETAEIAIHASLTGHLVLSTLHTNDAPSAATRLAEMGVQPFLMASSLLAVLAQRLVRRLCPHCRVPYRPTPEDVRALGLDPSAPALAAACFHRPAGCERCAGVGYRGRIGIFELMIVDDAVRRGILDGVDATSLMRIAQQRGMRTLREDGARQVLAGHTSVEEVLAATQGGEIG